MLRQRDRAKSCVPMTGSGDASSKLIPMSSERYYWVYILANAIGGTLYVGVTSDLVRRGYEHREDIIAGFTEKYGVHRLVYFEPHTDIEAAIRREKRLKRWNRAWKIRLIEENNPNWDDLYPNVSSS